MVQYVDKNINTTTCCTDRTVSLNEVNDHDVNHDKSRQKSPFLVLL